MADLVFERVGIIGAGTMGHGIAQVCAMAGMEACLYDLDDAVVAQGLSKIKSNLDKGVDRGKVSPELAEVSLTRLSGTTDLATVADGADLIVEAIPERLELKQDLFRQLSSLTPVGAVYGTNTSSLSVARIAEAAPDPSRVIGLHFFNPVHIMKLLEIIHHKGTDPQVMELCATFGEQIGKECIRIADFPGFATSRLGVCLGMEAIRMVEQGVGSAEDIDKAMVLGYRHPVGPLKLTDMVGLDVRLHIGEYLAKELKNPAFEPPDLMRQMVAEGRLGKKSGTGFYTW
jgi:3-hydroxybutyryl-CoA dehydrogenase